MTDMNELVRRLRDEEERMQRLWDACEAARVKHHGTPAAFDFNGLKHAVAGRDPVLPEAASFIEHSAKEVGAVSDEMVERACIAYTQYTGYYVSTKGMRRALEASRIPVVAGAGKWRCAECGGASYSHVDELKPDGHFAPGPNVRCVNCKAVTRPATPIESAPAAGVKALREALIQAGCTTYEGRRVEASMEDVLAALATPSSPDVELQAEVHVPGEFRCAKCGFMLSQFRLRASDGAIGDRDEPGEKCPNDGSPLWRVTWKERAHEHYERAVEEMRAREAAEARASSLLPEERA